MTTITKKTKKKYQSANNKAGSSNRSCLSFFCCYLVVFVTIVVVVTTTMIEQSSINHIITNRIITTDKKQNNHFYRHRHQEEEEEGKDKDKNNKNLAENIVYKSFNRTYALFDKVCNKKNLHVDPISDSNFMTFCFKLIYNEYQKYFTDEPVDKTARTSSIPTKRLPKKRSLLTKDDVDSIPWWFITLLRDAPKQKIDGWWHNLLLFNPETINQPSSETILPQSCTIEKIGTKQWQEVQCTIVGFKDNTTTTKNKHMVANNWACQKAIPIIEAKQRTMAKNYIKSKFVFLRDPLDRFLSGYIDKCETQRLNNVHCEPLEVFQKDPKVDGSLTEGLIIDKRIDTKYKPKLFNKRLLFNTYVDIFPLKWNMHFFPQGLYCNGIYRFHLDNVNTSLYGGGYDFVGYMNATHFNNDISRLSNKYDHIDGFTNALYDTFHFNDTTTTADNNGTTPSTYGKESMASARVLEYYTPRTLKKVLEYVSIDYVRLGLNIPDWAEQMLHQEEQEQNKMVG